ncbi:MAG TPA: M1 family metallopeptidase, partial [Chitinophagaceae bacterium]|nr:M1 family metallopeptidase [Chitinophagaceae bacterium]
MIKPKIFLISLPLLFLKIAAQQLPIPRNIRTAYDKGTRSPDGKPGKNYWQNTADYNLKINFDPVTRILDGAEQIVYTNNSPDTLRPIVFKLYPNIFKKGAVRNMPVLADDVTDGVKILSVVMNSDTIDPGRIRIDGTNMTISGKPIPSKQTVNFSVSWSYTLNKTPGIRTGEVDPGADFIAYFFPRIAVYDDLDGWNTYQYNGVQEFYNDFCHFKAAITVPSSQIVWATGNLLNATEVLKQTIYQRLQQAEKSDGIITVVDSTQISSATNRSAATNTWQFESNDVTDFVFACSDHYMWYSSSLVVDKSTGRRTRIDAAFNPKHQDYFDVINQARKTVEAMSYQFPKWPYPYSHETVFDGLDQMEYPMMVNDNPLADHAESVELTDHEIFHTMFPFYMGVNETKYAWMDEGWATVGEWIISPIIDSTVVDEYGVAAVERNAGNETDLPITTLSTEISKAYFTNSYPKPAMGYLFVRDMLGDENFYKGLHYYFQQWHSKHPMPLDFFNCMNKGSGTDLNWFWKKWFYDNGIPDLGIWKVVQTGAQKQITVRSIGNKPVPVDLAVTFDDESTKKFHLSIGVWEKGNKTTTIKFISPKKITEIKLGSVHTPDSNKKDNA